MLRLLFVALLATSANLAVADILTGNQLHEVCGKDGVDSEFACHMYIIGGADMYGLWRDDLQDYSRTYCTPKGVNRGQVVDIVRSYLEAHPESRHLPAVAIIIVALMEQFPCPKD